MIPPGQPPGQEKPFIEWEFDFAKEKERFCFIIDKKRTPGWPQDEDHIETDPAMQEKLDIFLKRVKQEQILDWFSTPLDLAYRVATSLGQHLWQEGVRAKQWFKIYSAIWQPASELTPQDVMGPERAGPLGRFNAYYEPREEDRVLQKKLTEQLEGKLRKHPLLVIGRPLAGKSRLIYEVLHQLEEPVDVLIPRYENFEQHEFFIPAHTQKGHHKLLLLDDLQQYILNSPNFPFLLKQFLTQPDILILATCRSKVAYEEVEDILLKRMNIDLANVFTSLPVGPITETLAKNISNHVQIPWEEVEFNGTVGSIFLKLPVMRNRYKKCKAQPKAVLRTLKLCYYTGLFQGRQEFPLPWVKTLAHHKSDLPTAAFRWDAFIEGLEALEFVQQTDTHLLT